MSNLSHISATLENGRFYSGALKKSIVFIIALNFLLIILSVFVGILTICSSRTWEGAIILAFGVILGSGTAGYFLHVLYKNALIEKSVEDSLKDAILLQARIYDCTESLHDRIYNGVKILIEFEYDGIHYKRKSNGRWNGHDKVFRTYVNQKEVKILFSPATQQILFLKNYK